MSYIREVPAKTDVFEVVRSIDGAPGKCPYCGVEVAPSAYHQCTVVTLTFDELPGFRVTGLNPMSLDSLRKLRNLLSQYVLALEAQEAGDARL